MFLRSKLKVQNMTNRITEKFVQMSIPHYVQMLDAIEKYYDARYDVTKSLYEVAKLKYKTFEYNADLQAIFNGLVGACKENNINLFDVLEYKKIQENFLDAFFFFCDDISEEVEPNTELTNQSKKIFLEILKNHS